MTVSNATVVRVRGVALDEYGDPSGSPEEETLDGCIVAPRTSSDVDDRGRQGVVVGLSLFAPFGTDITHTDQLRVDGVLYEIDGEPGRWKSPFSGWEAGVEVALRRAAG